MIVHGGIYNEKEMSHNIYKHIRNNIGWENDFLPIPSLSLSSDASDSDPSSDSLSDSLIFVFNGLTVLFKVKRE